MSFVDIFFLDLGFKKNHTAYVTIVSLHVFSSTSPQTFIVLKDTDIFEKDWPPLLENVPLFDFTIMIRLRLCISGRTPT
jgi:hypothetical protein